MMIIIKILLTTTIIIECDAGSDVGHDSDDIIILCMYNIVYICYVF